MSGSANRWVLRLSTEGADQVIRDLRAAATESAAAGRAYDALIKAQPALATGAERAEQALRKNVDAMRGMRGELSLVSAATEGAAGSLGRFGSALTSPAAAMTAMGAASAAGVAQIARLGDQYTETMNKLRAATGSVQAASAVYAELVAMSQQTGASISESAGAFVRFSVAARAIGATNGEVLQLTRTIQQAGLISGASTQEAAAGVQQLGQALASGQLQGDELRSILENMPTLAEALARELGVSVGQLRTMGSEGQLTSDRVFQALLRASEGINKQFNELTPTMGRAFGVLGQAMVEFVGKLDQALGLSQAIARAATAAAGAVTNVSRGIGPRSPAEQADFDVSEAQRRQAELVAEMERLRTGAPPASRRGSISRGLQETAASAQDRETRLAELQAAYEAENRVIAAALDRRNQAHQEADDVRQAEEATAQARRAAAARTAQTTAFNETRDALDRERKLRADHAARLTAIDAGLANGDTDAAGAARLRRIANEELADGLKALDNAARGRVETDESLLEVSRAVIDMERDRQSLLREGETVTQSVRSEAEKYADTLANLNNLLAAGAISQETYNRALAAADPAVKAAQEASRRIEQENTRTTDRITSFFGDAFARAFEGTGNGFRGLMESFRRAAISTFASIAAQAIIRPIVAPIVQGLGLGQLGIGGGGALNLGGLFGGGTAQAATPTGSGGGLSVADAAGFSTLRTAYNGLTSPGGLGSFFPGGAAVNTGWSGLDGVLNTTLYTPGTTGAVTSSGFYAGTALPGEAGAFIGGGGGAPSLTLAGSLGPLAAIGGGAYGIYSGLQKGGLGGALGAAGGAVSSVTGLAMLGSAAGLLPALGALGPVGLGVGAALAIAGALLPGQKASGQGQLARINLDSGDKSFEGLGGRRFSQGNRDAASGSVDNIAALARQVGDRLGGARIGGNAAVGVTNGTLYLDIAGRKDQFANSEEGAKQLATRASEYILQEFKDQFAREGRGDQTAAVLFNSSSVEALGENLQWYDQVYKAFTRTGEAADKTAEAIRTVEERFAPLIGKAQELGLSTDVIIAARNKEIAAVTKAVAEAEAARQAELASIRTGLAARAAATSAGVDHDARMLAAQASRAQAWAEELRALEQRLIALGETTENVAAATQKLREVQGAEYWRNFALSMEALDRSVIGRILRAEGRPGAADFYDFEAGAAQQVRDLAIALAELGLTSEQAAVKIGQTEQAIQAERNARIRAANEQITALDQSLTSRILRATGQGNAADLAEFEAAAARELSNVARSLTDLGMSAEEAGYRVLRTEHAIAVERIALQKRIADEAAAAQKQAAAEAAAAWERVLTAGQSIRGYIDAQRAKAGVGGVSTAEAFAAAQNQFGSDLALARSGDQDALARITSTADRLLELGQRQFASGVDFQAVRGFVLASLESLPATRSYDALILEELKKLGGAVNVEVGVTMIRAITEQLNALPEAERNRLIQSGEVQRRILQAVAAATGTPLIAPGTITRSITQAVETTETIQISRSIDDKLAGILNAQLVIGREQVILLGRMMTDTNHIWRYVLGEGGGVTVQARGWAHANTGNIVKFAQGGVFDGPVLFPMQGGAGMLGEAGPEAIMPLDRGPDGRLGVRATGGVSDALGRIVERMAREIAHLRGEMQRLVRAGERTAQATEETAASNATMARRDVIVGRRPRAA